MVPPDRAATSAAAAARATGAAAVGSGEGVEAPGRSLGRAACLSAPDGLVEIGLSGEQADQAVHPSEDNLAAPQVAHPLDPQAQSLDLGQQRRRAQVDQVAWQVEGEPAVPEGPGLKAGRIGHGDHQQPAWHEQARGMAQRCNGPAEVLERVPEDDRGPGSRHLLDPGVAKVRPGGVWLQADGFAAAAREGLDESAVTSSHIEHGAWWQRPVQAVGERRAGPAEHCVSQAREPAVNRPVPVAVRLVQLRLARPRRRRRHAAPGAPEPPGGTLAGTVEPVIAPRAPGRRGVPGRATMPQSRATRYPAACEGSLASPAADDGARTRLESRSR